MGYKTKSNKSTNKTDKQSHRIVVSREKREWEKDKDEEGQIYGDRRRLGFEWSAHNGVYRCCIIKL